MMIRIFAGLHPILQALLAGCLTWGLTAAGADLELVNGEAAEVLRPHEGIAALLRYRLAFDVDDHSRVIAR